MSDSVSGARPAGERMRRQTRHNTRPEMALRRELHGRGLRYFVHRRPLPGLRRKPTSSSWCQGRSLVDGCWWHGCPVHGGRAKTNDSFWAEKIEGNRVRDVDTDERLTENGWMVVRIWEHEPASVAASVVEVAVTERLKSGRRKARCPFELPGEQLLDRQRSSLRHPWRDGVADLLGDARLASAPPVVSRETLETGAPSAKVRARLTCSPPSTCRFEVSRLNWDHRPSTPAD